VAYLTVQRSLEFAAENIKISLDHFALFKFYLKAHVQLLKKKGLIKKKTNRIFSYHAIGLIENQIPMKKNQISKIFKKESLFTEHWLNRHAHVVLNH